MMDLIIPGEILEKTQLNHDDFLIELAVYLYDKEVLSIGKAKTLAKLDLISFQKKLADRNVEIKYDYDDYLTDMESLKDI
ncbi:MAG: UPF0175 family protein [Bacteroidota bacterium]